ncbi:hypothetical protein IFM89_004177 [Coptis chinensis]|uniref:Uncharacterized protein n=1 Tax=Coptis chinensis TaxID=261450 RepID=A0A835H8T0_9MAGN|nr:hypothetical protein IFM89_004177 [Coptis chinensis]
MASSSSQLRSITERMGMFSICCHVMMRNFAMIASETPFKQGVRTFWNLFCSLDVCSVFRYPSHYSRTPVIEQCVHWDRIRAPPIDIPPNNVHASDCLDKLHPGDHVEIQWRGNKELPYGVFTTSEFYAFLKFIDSKLYKITLRWWYGVVGHLETCDEIRSLCRYHKCGHLWEASSMEVICVCVCLFIDTGIDVWTLFTLLLQDPSLNMLASGSYGLIFSSFVPFYFDIPVSTRFHIFGINFSDKSFVYLAGLQLLFSSWKRSILPGICGVLAGLLYRSNIFGIHRIKFPEFVSSLFSRLSWPTLGGSSPSASSGNVIGNVPSYTGREVEASTASK